MPMRQNCKLEGEIAALGDRSRSELVELWVKAYGYPPPRGIRQERLVRAAAWHLQQRRLVGLSAESRRLLRSAMRRLTAGPAEPVGNEGVAIAAPDLAAEVSADVSSSTGQGRNPRAQVVRPMPQSGSRLMREWNGRMHVIDVLDGSYSFEGKTYHSLSAIARRITGARWSGPRFFGL